MLTGLVLAGGKSRRFGTDKALFTMPGLKKSNIEITVNRLQKVCEQVLVVTNRSNKTAIKRLVTNKKVSVISDLPSCQEQGPLAALITAQSYGINNFIVNACDYPFLTVKAIELLKKHPNTYLTASFPHYTLCHLILKKSQASDYFHAGNRALGPFLKEVCHCKPLYYQAEELELKNCNYQE